MYNESTLRTLRVFTLPVLANNIPSHFYNNFLGFFQDINRSSKTDFDHGVRIQVVQDLSVTDVCTLPYSWNYYVDLKKIDQAEQFIHSAQQANKQVVIFSTGDFAANIPFSNIILLESSGYRSRRGVSGNQIWGLPTFIRDYIALYNNGNLANREKGKFPVVGFCGQADGNLFDFSRRYILNRWRWTSYKLGFRKWEPAPYETTYFRKKILDILANSPKVETDFIRRIRYRGGYWDKKKNPQHSSRLEFIYNILGTDYTVCMRGGGNFSFRFYEVLSLGRIPIFIDTDCILPLDDCIDYRQYCVWVNESEIPYLAEKVADFHASLTPQGFIDLQHECRKLWEENFTKGNFYTKLCNQLLSLANQ